MNATTTAENGAAQAAPPMSMSTSGIISPFDVIIIGIDEERDNEAHPLWDERIKYRVEEAFKANVSALGVTTPVILRREGAKLYVVDGRQRVRAARAVSSKKAPLMIPFIERGGEMDDAIEVGIGANIHKDDPLDVKARKLQRYLSQGFTAKDAATTFGVDVETIRNWERFQGAHEALQDAWRKGKIAPSAVFPIARLPAEKQEEALKEAIENSKGRKVTARATQKAAQGKGKGKGGKAKTEPKYPPPGKRLLSKLVDAGREKTTLTDEQHHLLRWVLGMCPPKSVPNLTVGLEALEEPEAEETSEE